MPKIVDHDERRAQIVAAVTRIIMRDGFDRVTMREIEAEAGYSHGGMTRYFSDKQSLLTAAFVDVFEKSHAESLALVSDVRGLEALRRFCLLVLPEGGDEEPRYTRLLLSFWDRAAQDPALWEVHHTHFMERRELIRRLLTEAEADGELAPGLNIENAIDRVAATNAGWQMLAALVPESQRRKSIVASVDALLHGLRTFP